MSQGVYVLEGKCPRGKCPRRKCPGELCPWGKCSGGYMSGRQRPPTNLSILLQVNIPSSQTRLRRLCFAPYGSG